MTHLRKHLRRRVTLPDHLLDRLLNPLKPSGPLPAPVHLDVLLVLPDSERAAQLAHDRIGHDATNLLHRDRRDRF